MESKQILLWFENEDFLAGVIHRGIGAGIEAGSDNQAGLITYLYDERHQIDAKNIAQAVREFNDKHSQERS